MAKPSNMPEKPFPPVGPSRPIEATCPVFTLAIMPVPGAESLPVCLSMSVPVHRSTDQSDGQSEA
jgi:hypothetical protein